MPQGSYDLLKDALKRSYFKKIFETIDNKDLKNNDLEEEYKNTLVENITKYLKSITLWCNNYI